MFKCSVANSVKHGRNFPFKSNRKPFFKVKVHFQPIYVDV